jgi:hypothetical protein
VKSFPLRFQPGKISRMSEPNGPTEQAAYERQLKHRERELAMQKSDQVQKAHNDKMMLLVTTASVIVAAVASYAGMRTVSEARQARIEARQAAENSYALQKQTFDIEERPFLAIDIKGLPPAPQPRLGLGNFDISLVAFGKTPARNVHFVCAVQPNSGDVTPWKRLPKLDFQFKFAYILPSRSETVGCQSFLEYKAHNEDGTQDNVILGVADYTDDAGHSYITPICATVIEFAAFPTKVLQCQTNQQMPELK